jgi:hypothetical protein
MNQLLPYEKNIAGKMDELPLPDMKEAIWNAIQDNISPETPDSSLGENNITEATSIGTAKIVAGFIITAIICTVVVMVATKKKKARENTKPSQEKIQPIPSKTDSPLNEYKPEHKKLRVTAKENDTAFLLNNFDDTITNIIPPSVESLIPDSANKLAPVLPPLKDTARKTLPPNKKKNIGVTGISDSSYRISGKKDSLKN